MVALVVVLSFDFFSVQKFIVKSLRFGMALCTSEIIGITVDMV